MEQDVLKNAQIKEIVKDYKIKGFSDASCNLLREDLDYGIPVEQAKCYMQDDLSIETQRSLSKALREHLPQELIDLAITQKFDVYQIDKVIEAYKSGFPLEEVIKIAKEKPDAYSMSEAFSELKASLDAATESIQSEKEIPAEVKEMLSKLSSLMEGIGDNAKHYDELLQKLDGLKSDEPSEAVNALKDQLSAKDEKISSLEDEIKAKNQQIMDITNQLKDKEQEANYSSKSNEELEQQLSDQQNKLNNALNRANTLESEVEKLNKQIETLKEEKNHMEKEQVQTSNVEDKELEQAMQPTVLGFTQNSSSAKPEQKVTPPCNKQDGMPVHYQTVIMGSDGSTIPIVVERAEKKKPKGLFAMAEMFMPTKAGKNLVKKMAENKLNKDQMGQIRNAILSGLDEAEVADIIDSGFTAEEMAEAIAVLVADKNYN